MSARKGLSGEQSAGHSVQHGHGECGSVCSVWRACLGNSACIAVCVCVCGVDVRVFVCVDGYVCGCFCSCKGGLEGEREMRKKAERECALRWCLICCFVCVLCVCACVCVRACVCVTRLGRLPGPGVHSDTKRQRTESGQHVRRMRFHFLIRVAPGAEARCALGASCAAALCALQGAAAQCLACLALTSQAGENETLQGAQLV